MPYCPQCKSEFQEGFTTCSDCRVDLVDELVEVIEYIPFFQSEEKSITIKLKNFFKYSNLTSYIRYQDEYQAYLLYITSDQLKQAQKLYQAFYFVEREKHEKQLLDQIAQMGETRNPSLLTTDPDAEEAIAEENAEDISLAKSASLDESTVNISEHGDYEDDSIETEHIQPGRGIYSDTWKQIQIKSKEDTAEEEEEYEIPKSNTYVMKMDKYKDYTSTVWIFISLGILGIIFVFLNGFGILTMLNGLFSNLVMGAVFLFFIYIGLSTHQRAKSLKLEATEEEQLTGQINEWLKNHVTKEYVTSLADDTSSDELNFLHVTGEIKEQLIKEFGQKDEAYLDFLIEKHYNENIDTNN